MNEVHRLIEITRLARALQENDLKLRDVVERALAKQPGTDRLLLVADQWEELYTLTQDEAGRRRFYFIRARSRGRGASDLGALPVGVDHPHLQRRRCGAGR